MLAGKYFWALPLPFLSWKNAGEGKEAQPLKYLDFHAPLPFE